VLGSEAFVLRFFGEEGHDRLMLVNFGPDFRLSAAPEPLLAPAEGTTWKLIWSSEDPRYGGFGTPPLGDGAWRISGHAALVLASEKIEPVKGKS
jgi:maltooligosyltrehalose trehalohydrolase